MMGTNIWVICMGCIYRPYNLLVECSRLKDSVIVLYDYPRGSLPEILQGPVCKSQGRQLLKGWKSKHCMGRLGSIHVGLSFSIYFIKNWNRIFLTSANDMREVIFFWTHRYRNLAYSMQRCKTLYWSEIYSMMSLTFMQWMSVGLLSNST